MQTIQERETFLIELISGLAKMIVRGELPDIVNAEELFIKTQGRKPENEEELIDWLEVVIYHSYRSYTEGTEIQGE